MKSWEEWLEDTVDRMFWVSLSENMSQETFKMNHEQEQDVQQGTGHL